MQNTQWGSNWFQSSIRRVEFANGETDLYFWSFGLENLLSIRVTWQIWRIYKVRPKSIEIKVAFTEIKMNNECNDIFFKRIYHLCLFKFFVPASFLLFEAPLKLIFDTFWNCRSITFNFEIIFILGNKKNSHSFFWWGCRTCTVFCLSKTFHLKRFETSFIFFSNSHRLIKSTVSTSRHAHFIIEVAQVCPYLHLNFKLRKKKKSKFQSRYFWIKFRIN